MTIFLLIFFISIVIYSFLIDFYRRSWNRIPVYDIDEVNDVKVSVIIALRNEATNIPQLFKQFDAQNYAKHLYEVIMIDDHSTDGTWQLLTQVKDVNFPLRSLRLPEGADTKKKAIEYGISIAKGELIVTTDGDCRISSEWIKAFASFYKITGAKFIAAPVMMEAGNSLKDIFQSLDFLAMQAITGASVHRQFHTMCNGANLAYEKQVFFEVNGFEGIDKIPSGDDMLLMYKIYSRYPNKVKYMKNSEAVVSTKPEPTWNDFINQRIRWASKAVHYRDKRIFYVLLLTYLLNIFYLILGIATFVKFYWFTFLLLFLLAKVLIEFPFVNSAAIFFGQQRLMKFFPFLQPLHIVYVIIAGWLGRFGSYKWKSRTIKNKGREKLVKQ